MELSRRFFLGGAISLLAASTFVPSVSASGNLPRIWGDGKHDDTSGLGALFRKEPVILTTDNVGVDEHKGITFHGGRFKITQTIELPDPTVLPIRIESTTFDLLDLDKDFYALRGTPEALVPFTGKFAPRYDYYQPRRNAMYVGEDLVRPASLERGVADRRLILDTVVDGQSEEDCCGYGEMSAIRRMHFDRDRQAALEFRKEKERLGLVSGTPECQALYDRCYNNMKWYEETVPLRGYDG